MPKSIFHVAVDPLFELRVPTVKQLVGRVLWRNVTFSNVCRICIQ